tara:strand:- start:101 stop:1492 length:1392 start_codon:yes stop_codon:yes gene_type:complete
VSSIRIDIPKTMAGYRRFIQCKKLPSYRVEGRTVITDECSYRAVFGGEKEEITITGSAPHLMPFQAALVERALDRRHFAIFADCGLGKTPMGLAWAHHVAEKGKVLILVPLAVFEQWKRECKRFHGTTMIDLRAGEQWDDGIAILNWESRRAVDMTGVVGIVLDESSILKNADGETSRWLCDLVAGLPYRLAISATPAPNSHYEYATHARFLGRASTVKEYAARYFKKDGTRWVLRGHAIKPFYDNLSMWASYIYSPRALGYGQSTEMPTEPEYRYQRLGVHPGFVSGSGELFATASMGADRSKVFGELRWSAGPRLDSICEYARGKRLIVWVKRNKEESVIAKALPGRVGVVNGSMSIEARIGIIDRYRSGELDHLVSKPSVMGWGVNLPECNHMVYSGFDYSFESFYQAIRRAHRYGREGRLEVMIPYTDPEAAILTGLQDKAARFRVDCIEMQNRFWRQV